MFKVLLMSSFVFLLGCGSGCPVEGEKSEKSVCVRYVDYTYFITVGKVLVPQTGQQCVEWGSAALICRQGKWETE